VVLKEAIVLCSQECLSHDLRDLLVHNRRSALLADLGHEGSTARIDTQRYLKLDIPHLRDRRKCRFEEHEHAR
jgi:hypothetical protein